jgi:hypothetical protein
MKWNINTNRTEFSMSLMMQRSMRPPLNLSHKATERPPSLQTLPFVECIILNLFLMLFLIFALFLVTKSLKCC